MPRTWIVLIGMLAATTLSSGGCRSCSSCHDYDPPVANCECNSCGCHPAGSASGGYASEGYVEGEYSGEPPMNEASAEEPGGPMDPQ